MHLEKIQDGRFNLELLEHYRTDTAEWRWFYKTEDKEPFVRNDRKQDKKGDRNHFQKKEIHHWGPLFSSSIIVVKSGSAQLKKPRSERP